MMRCRICGSDKIEIFSLKTRKYARCNSCGSICTCPESFDSIEGQRSRYEQHHNSLSDEGYRKFLEDFILPVLQETGRHITSDMKQKTSIVGNNGSCLSVKEILDYGSGPEPALCELLREYAQKNIYLSHDCEIRGWDPFFAPETPFFEDGADLVTCLEVAEHFETPLEDMKKLASAVKPGGFAAIGTMLLPVACGAEMAGDENTAGICSEAFKNWWYRSDSTHVAFYTLEGLKMCASSAGLTFVSAVTDRAFLFRKTV